MLLDGAKEVEPPLKGWDDVPKGAPCDPIVPEESDGAPKAKGSGALPKADPSAGGKPIFDASPDMYPVSIVEFGESTPKAALVP